VGSAAQLGEAGRQDGDDLEGDGIAALTREVAQAPVLSDPLEEQLDSQPDSSGPSPAMRLRDLIFYLPALVPTRHRRMLNCCQIATVGFAMTKEGGIAIILLEIAPPQAMPQRQALGEGAKRK
jgi:hypothetical protein